MNSQGQRIGHIFIEIVSYTEGRLIVRAEQKDLINDKFLTKKELTERVREMFKGGLIVCVSINNKYWVHFCTQHFPFLEVHGGF